MLVSNDFVRCNSFLQRLSATVLRQIERIVVIALHGQPHEAATVSDAIAFIENYRDADTQSLPVRRYEIGIRYNNGNTIKGRFADKESTVAFLRTHEPLLPESMER